MLYGLSSCIAKLQECTTMFKAFAMTGSELQSYELKLVLSSRARSLWRSDEACLHNEASMIIASPAHILVGQSIFIAVKIVR